MLLGELGLDGSLLSHNSLRRSTSVCPGCQPGTCGALGCWRQWSGGRVGGEEVATGGHANESNNP